MIGIEAVILAGTIYFAIVGEWKVALALYLLSATSWTWHERRQSVLVRAIGYSTLMGTFVLFALWPLRIIFVVSRRRDSKRFVVAGGGESARFGRWDEAIQYAKDRAFQLQRSISVSDFAKWEKVDGVDRPKSWLIDIEGNVERMPFCHYSG